jgi:hypothetical protein
VSVSESDILGSVYKTETLSTSLAKRGEDGLCFVHRFVGTLDGDLPAVFKGAARRAKAAPHPCFERVVDVGNGVYVTEFLAAERLEQLHTSALYSGDQSLPADVVWRLFLDLAEGLAALHVAGQTSGPFGLAHVVLGIDGRARFVGQPVSAIATHRSGTLSTSASDLRDLAALAQALKPATDTNDGSWSAILEGADKIVSGHCADGEDCVDLIKQLSGDAGSHGYTARWLQGHYRSRIAAWQSVDDAENPAEIVSQLLNQVPVREAPEPPVVKNVAQGGKSVGGVRNRSAIASVPRGQLSLDEMLGPLTDTNPMGDPDSAPVLEVVRVAEGVVRSVDVLYPGQRFSDGGLVFAKLNYEGASISVPKDADGVAYRNGESQEIHGTFELRVGDRAAITHNQSVYRLSLNYAARSSGKSTGRRIPWKLWAVCLLISVGSHVGFGITASMFITANIELPTRVDEEELFARDIMLEDLKEKKKPEVKKKKKKKPKPKIKKKKKKKKPKKKVEIKPDPKAPQPVITNKLREKLNKRIRKARAKGESTAQSLLKQVMKESDSETPSLADVRANIDAVAATRGRSASSVMGSLIHGAPGERIVARGSGGGVVGTKRGVAGGTGRLRSRGRRAKIRGKVKTIRALTRVRGSLDKGKVLRLIEKILPRIRRCYERELMKGKKKLSGKITAQWNIKPNGRVSGARIKVNTLGSPKVAKCVLKEIKRIRFPKPKGGSVEIVYPFIFASR